MQIQAWTPTILSAITGILTIAVSYTVTREKVKQIDMEKNELKKDLKQATEQLSNAVAAITILQHEQAIINKFTATTLESLVKRIESQEGRIGDLEGTIKLLAELVRRLENLERK